MTSESPLCIQFRCDTTPALEAIERVLPLLRGFSQRFGDAFAEGFADLIHKGIDVRLVESRPTAGANGDYVCTLVVSIPWIDEIFPATRARDRNDCFVCGHEHPFCE